MQRDIIQNDTILLRLDRNECICPSVMQNIIKSANIEIKDYFTYTSSFNTIKKLSRELNVNPDNLYISNGSEAILKNIVEILNCEKWYFTTPTFELFPFYCSLYNKKVDSIVYTYNNGKFNLNLNFKDINSAIYLVSPHNPTGHVLNIDEVKKLCSNFKYVVIDQAYVSPLEQLNITQLPNNLIIVRTFSKMGGLTGMRFGYCISNNAEIMFNLNQHRPMFLNSITLKLVNSIIDFNYKETIESEFNACAKKLSEELSDNYILRAGNFILLKDTPEYKGYPLKKYSISNNIFYRLTLFDLETYTTL
jgi:histidinol-phosphate aminotransferase